MKKEFCLCKGRHEMPVTESIFENELNPLDLAGMAATVAEQLQGVTELVVYVTGLTVALVEVIKYCNNNNIKLILMHFDRNTNSYYPQQVF